MPAAGSGRMGGPRQGIKVLNTKPRRAKERATGYKRHSVETERTSGAMPPIPDSAVFQERLATLPLKTYEAGETVFAAGSRTGLLLILRKGSVVIEKEGVEIAKVVEPGAVFGELSVFWTNRTQRTFELSKPRSFWSPMRRPFSHKIRLQRCMLLRSSRGG